MFQQHIFLCIFVKFLCKPKNSQHLWWSLWYILIHFETKETWLLSLLYPRVGLILSYFLPMFEATTFLAVWHIIVKVFSSTITSQTRNHIKYFWDARSHLVGDIIWVGLFSLLLLIENPGNRVSGPTEASKCGWKVYKGDWCSYLSYHCLDLVI
jgi:hypothetical protein